MRYESIAFEGTIKQMRRGGWAARGLVVAHRNGQRVETQIGPQGFDSEDRCDLWLRAEASRLNIKSVLIVVGSSYDDDTMRQLERCLMAKERAQDDHTALQPRPQPDVR